MKWLCLKRLSSIIIAAAILLAVTLPARPQTVEEQIQFLQQQIDELRAQSKKEQSGAQTARITDKQTNNKKQWPQASFGGQYRINFYNADNDTSTDDQRAGRARIRQNIDLQFSEGFNTHLQLELSHTTSNVTTTNAVSVRHAVIDYAFKNGTKLQAGLAPLHDYYHDTLFSSDWDYNPLAASIIFPLGAAKVRLFAANLGEGAENIENDDFVHYQADYSLPIGKDGQLTVSATTLNLQNDSLAGSDDSFHYNVAAGARLPFGNGLAFNGLVVGSWSDAQLLGTTRNASGVAVLAELTGAAGPGEFGLLLSYASGESDGTGFLSPMAFAQTFGYWGYTGILTVQGPTDTGFDFDGINISNNGYGLSTVQAKYSVPLGSNLNGYLAAGWFGNTDAGGRDDTVGYDLLAMGTYRFTKFLALDFGVAYAKLNDSVSGYFQSVQNNGQGPAFNQSVGSERNKWALFGRFQAEF